MEIREAKEADLAHVVGLYRHLHSDDIEVSTEDLSRAWKEMMSSGPGVTVYVGEMAAEIVASCMLVTVPNLTRGARPYGLIENVVTHADHRRKGYGSALLRHALEIAWKLGCYKVMLLTGSSRDSTLRFYEKAGFERGVKTGFVAYSPRHNKPVQPTTRCARGG